MTLEVIPHVLFSERSCLELVLFKCLVEVTGQPLVLEYFNCEFSPPPPVDVIHICVLILEVRSLKLRHQQGHVLVGFREESFACLLL